MESPWGHSHKGVEMVVGPARPGPHTRRTSPLCRIFCHAAQDSQSSLFLFGPESSHPSRLCLDFLLSWNLEKP